MACKIASLGVRRRLVFEGSPRYNGELQMNACEQLPPIQPNFARKMTQYTASLRSYVVAVVTFATAALSATFSAGAWAQKGLVPAESLQGKIAICIGCHGIQGYQASFPEIHRVPRISGQSEGYIASALAAYKSGERKHPTMKAVAANLSEKDMADMAAYYASHAQEGAVALPETPKEASAAVAILLQKGACVSCHGANFNKPNAANVPKIGGQYDDYLYVALKSYKTEGAAKHGRANAVMGGMVKQYSLAELKQIANYIGSLDTNLKTEPQSKFRSKVAAVATTKQ
jgi:cytochrome c553